jgi:chromosome segregation ATPase
MSRRRSNNSSTPLAAQQGNRRHSRDQQNKQRNGTSLARNNNVVTTQQKQQIQSRAGESYRQKQHQQAAQQQLARVQSEQRAKLQQQQIQSSADPNQQQQQKTSGHRDGKQLWNTVKKKPITLSQKNRALEDAVKVLQQRLADNNLETTVDGEDPVPPDKEILTLRNKVTQLQDQCNAAAAHKRAAELFEKQYRDTRAELEKWKDGKDDLIQQLTLKESELKLSADAGALARRDLQLTQAKVTAKEVEISGHCDARKEAERALQEAKNMIELMKKQLADLREQLVRAEEAKEHLKEQTERLTAHVKALETSTKVLTEQQNENKETTISSEQDKVKIEAMEEEKKRLIARVDAQESEIARLLQLEKTLATALKQHETTVAALDARTSELSIMNNKLDASTKLNADTNIKMSETEQELLETQSALNEYKIQLCQSEEKCQTVQTQSDAIAIKLETEISSTTSLKQDIVNLKTSLTKEKSSRVKEQNEMEVTVQKLNKKIEELGRDLNSRVSSVSNDKDKQVAELFTLQEQLQEAIARAEGAENDSIELKKKMQELKNEIVTHVESLSTVKKQHISLDAQLQVSTDRYASLQLQLTKMTEECDVLKSKVHALESGIGGAQEDLDAKHEVAASLRRLAESLQQQLDESITSQTHMKNELERERTNLSCAEQERDEHLASLKATKLKVTELEHELQNETETMMTLESTIETLSTQLGSLVDSGEAFEANSQKREDNLMNQIQRLRRGRQKDREAYKTAVEASNAWRVRAENAESMLANRKSSSVGGGSNKKKNSGSNSDGSTCSSISGVNGNGSSSTNSRSSRRGRGNSGIKRPTPPSSTNKCKDDVSSVSSSARSTPRRQRKFVASGSLPPVASASPSTRLQAPS